MCSSDIAEQTSTFYCNGFIGERMNTENVAGGVGDDRGDDWGCDGGDDCATTRTTTGWCNEREEGENGTEHDDG